MSIKINARETNVKVGKNPAIQITCIDRNGEIVKRVTSGDSGEVEEEPTPDPSQGEGSQNVT